MDVTYTSYLKLGSLLDMQRPLSDPEEHDELLFIVIHQVYELWFKLLLHEFDAAKRQLSANDLFGAIATFKRVRMVMKTLVGQLDILETMTPMSFLAFRDRLEHASGFQSMQFRELEFLLGYKRDNVLSYYDSSMPGYDRAVQRLREPSIVDHFYDFLEHRGAEVPTHLRTPEPTAPTEPDETVQGGLIRLYRQCPDVAILLELMTDFDEGLQEWRYRHVKMVERTIGNKQGTGGSLGVAFLRDTLFHPIFPDLWAIRHHL
jgi:tryptophan 2,3-dioxygenase